MAGNLWFLTDCYASHQVRKGVRAMKRHAAHQLRRMEVERPEGMIPREQTKAASEIQSSESTCRFRASVGALSDHLFPDGQGRTSISSNVAKSLRFSV